MLIVNLMLMIILFKLVYLHQIQFDVIIIGELFLKVYEQHVIERIDVIYLEFF